MAYQWVACPSAWTSVNAAFCIRHDGICHLKHGSLLHGNFVYCASTTLYKIAPLILASFPHCSTHCLHFLSPLLQPVLLLSMPGCSAATHPLRSTNTGSFWSSSCSPLVEVMGQDTAGLPSIFFYPGSLITLSNSNCFINTEFTREALVMQCLWPAECVWAVTLLP